MVCFMAFLCTQEQEQKLIFFVSFGLVLWDFGAFLLPFWLLLQSKKEIKFIAHYKIYMSAAHI